MTAAVKLEEIALLQELEEARETVQTALEKAEAAAVETLMGGVYTKTVVEEQQVAYEDAKELMGHVQKKDYIARDCKRKDTIIEGRPESRDAGIAEEIGGCPQPFGVRYFCRRPLLAPVIKCKKTPRKKCRLVAEVRKKR